MEGGLQGGIFLLQRGVKRPEAGQLPLGRPGGVAGVEEGHILPQQGLVHRPRPCESAKLGQIPPVGLQRIRREALFKFTAIQIGFDLLLQLIHDESLLSFEW